MARSRAWRSLEAHPSQVEGDCPAGGARYGGGVTGSDIEGIPARLAEVRRQIDEACRKARRVPGVVRLLAVSKTQPWDSIAPVLAAGQTVFGENRVQEAQERWSGRREGLELHLIGPPSRSQTLVRALIRPPAAGARPPKGGSAHAPAPGGGAKPTAAPTAWAAALAIEFLRRTPPRLFLLLCGTVLAFTAYARFVGVIVPDHRSSYLLAVFAAVAVWLVFLWRFFSVASAVQDAWLKAGRPSLSLAPKAGEQWDPMKEIVDNAPLDF